MFENLSWEMCVLETTAQCVREKMIKSSGKSQIYLLFFACSGNDVRRKLYTVRIHSTVEKRAKGMPDITVETTKLIWNS